MVFGGKNFEEKKKTLFLRGQKQRVMEPERLFKRKIYNRLLKWKKESNGKSALLIEGARRIGKSTIVKNFKLETQL